MRPKTHLTGMRFALACAIGIALTISSVGGLSVAPAKAAGSQVAGRALVVGSNDNGSEGDNLAATLSEIGLDVTRHRDNLPEGWDVDHTEVLSTLLTYQSIWYVEAYEGLTDEEADLLVEYANAGGNLYLTGERPCCEPLNTSVNGVLSRLLADDVSVGGMGDIDGPFAFNGSAIDGVTTSPNLLVDFVPHSPGGIKLVGIDGVNGPNVFASSDSVVVGGVWDESDMKSAKGRVALLMDIDWLNDEARKDIIENLANFLSAGGLCSDEGDQGLEWTAGPRNCDLITPGTYTWSAKIESGSGPYFEHVVDDGVSASCTYTLTPPTARYTCKVTLDQAIDVTSRRTLKIRATADGPGRQLVRTLRVREPNDSRNVPDGYAVDSNWWEWPDSDQDGLPDKWETDGVWVNGTHLDLSSLGADPKHKDLFVRYDYEEGYAPSEDTLAYMREMFANAPLSNPSGGDGVNLHIDLGKSVPSSVIGSGYYTLDDGAIQRVGSYTGFFSSPGYGGGGVPTIYKSMINLPQPDGDVIGMAYKKGQFAWTGWSLNWFWDNLPVRLEGWDNLNRGKAASFAQASNAAHELGHTLGLLHHNDTDEPTHDTAYKSIMSYSYSNFGLVKDGHSVLDYSRSSTPKLDWKLGPAYGSITFIHGQDGEAANDFYNDQPDQTLPLYGEKTEPHTATEIVQQSDPESIGAFFEAFDAPEVPKPPTLNDVSTQATVGSPIDVTLDGADPYGGTVEYVVDGPSTNGEVGATASGLHYVPKRAGIETLQVRAVAGLLSSEPATVTITVLSGSPKPVIDDPTPVTDQELTATPGDWDQSGLSFSYQWYRRSPSGKVRPISRATSETYRVRAADGGYRLRVKVTGLATGQKPSSKYSAWTSKVAKAPFTSAPTPSVVGVVRVGMPLTAAPGTWDPAATLKYQWCRVSATGKSTAIKKATKATYRPTSTDKGRSLKVRVRGYRSGYITTTRYSEPTTSVSPGMVGPTPMITGTPRVDQEVTADEGTWSPSDATFSYQWYARSPSGKVYRIADAKSRIYQVEGRYAGFRLKVQVTGVADEYASVTKTSRYTATIAKGAFISKPVPVIEGTAKVGQALTVDEGDWQPIPSWFGYQWYRSGAAISGAIKNAYTLTGKDEGASITVKVTAKRSGYVTASATSTSTDTVAP